MADKKLLGSCRIETIVMHSQNLFMYYRLSLNMGQKCSHMRKVKKKVKSIMMAYVLLFSHNSDP
jgi:hypothetical protein